MKIRPEAYQSLILGRNLSDLRGVKVKPYLAKNRLNLSLKAGFKQKAIAPLVLPVMVLVMVLIGFAIYMFFLPKIALTGTPSAPPDTSKSEQVESAVVTQCAEGQLLNNEGKCIIPPCPAGMARNNEGICVLIESAGQTTTPGVNPGFVPQGGCQPTGYFKSAYAYHKKKIGDSSNLNRGAPLSYQFVVTNTCDADIYVEAGLLKAGDLTILVTQPSACDGNPHFAGKFLRGNANTRFASNQPPGVIDVAFFPQDYNRAERLRLVGGVYSGCLKDGGKTIAEVPPQTLRISNSYTDTEITASVTKII